MDSTFPIVGSDNESDSDILELSTDEDFPTDEEGCLQNNSKHKIGSVWRDMVVGEQMEGCLTHLKVTSKKPSYTDMDDPNYKPMNSGYKRKRIKNDFSSFESNQNTENVSENEKCDLESNHVLKKRYSHGNGNFNKCNYNYTNSKGYVEKRETSSNNTKSRCRVLPEISDSDEKTFDQFLDELCTNLHEHNKVLMLSVISKIDRKTILEKYNKTCLIEANGGQMIKNGNRRRTSGGIFFNLIKEDKSIPNSAKKTLFGSSQNDEIKKKNKRQKMKQKKEKLKKMLLQNKKEADILKKLNEELETIASTSTLNDEEFQSSDSSFTISK